MCDADSTVDGEGRGQILIKAVKPRAISLIDQLSHTNHLWKEGEREKEKENESMKVSLRI